MSRLPTPDVLGDILGAPPSKPNTVELSSLRLDAGTQFRDALDEQHLKRLAEALTLNPDNPFPAVTVYFDGQSNWLADGFHRAEATLRHGSPRIAADIRSGSRRDAVLYAAGANGNHGLPRTQSYKRRAVRCLLEDAEWRDWSDREIARRCNVSPDLVGEIRRELYPPAPAAVTVDSDSEPAPAATPQHRTYTTKTGTVAVMDTSRIGQRPEPAYTPVWVIETYVGMAYRDLFPQEDSNAAIAAAAEMRRQARAGAGNVITVAASLLTADGREFRKRDLIQAINNYCVGLERDTHVPSPAPAAVDETPAAKLLVDWTPDDWAKYEREHQAQPEPQLANMGRGLGPKAYRIAALVPDVVEFLRTYRDHLGRTWSALEPKSAAHRNSVLWRDITSAWANRSIPEDVLMAAIKGAFEELRKERLFAELDAQEQRQPAAVPVSQRDDYDSDEWYTPEEIIRTAAVAMGAISLDPASCELAQTVVQAAAYYTKDADGLKQPWKGNVWLNPPYSQPQAWIDKLFREIEAGRVTQAIVLVNNATETTWFQRLLCEAKLVCFPSRRLAFWRHDHSNVGARQGQALFYFGNRAEAFFSAFGATGAVLRRLK